MPVLPQFDFGSSLFAALEARQRRQAQEFSQDMATKQFGLQEKQFGLEERQANANMLPGDVVQSLLFPETSSASPLSRPTASPTHDYSQPATDKRMYGDIPIPAEGRSLLDIIGRTESKGSYDTLYGGGTFSDFSQHPNKPVPITSGPNAGQYSTAAGKYQFLKSTWDEVAKKGKFSDFSPENQDRGAWLLAQDVYRKKTGNDLSEALRKGDMTSVADALRGTWTSLPGGIESQYGKEDKFALPPTATQAPDRTSVAFTPPEATGRNVSSAMETPRLAKEFTPYAAQAMQGLVTSAREYREKQEMDAFPRQIVSQMKAGADWGGIMENIAASPERYVDAVFRNPAIMQHAKGTIDQEAEQYRAMARQSDNQSVWNKALSWFRGDATGTETINDIFRGITGIKSPEERRMYQRLLELGTAKKFFEQEEGNLVSKALNEIRVYNQQGVR